MIREKGENAMEILAKFRDGREAVYTTGIFELLVTDPFVEWIVDANTGEILYEKEGR